VRQAKNARIVIDREVLRAVDPALLPPDAKAKGTVPVIKGNFSGQIEDDNFPTLFITS